MTYDPVHVRAPRLTGPALSAVTTLLEHPFPGKPVAQSTLRGIGLEQFRKHRFHEPPRYYPFVTPPADGRGKGPGPEEIGTTRQPEGSHHYPSIFDYNHRYREADLDPREVAERIIDTIQDHEHRDTPLHIFISFNPDEIRRQADESARRFRTGKARSILEGVPVAIKDEVDVEGHATTVGTSFLKGERARSDAAVVRRLRESGAIILGKTNMHEIGIGVTGLNPFHGTPINPFAPHRYPGGSSSGSGSAVGAGICPLAIGADGGGSIRVPAAYCGVYGLKMTWGRVSTAGEFPLARSVANTGPIAANARDLALAYLITAGEDPADPVTIGTPAPELHGFLDGIDGVRIGVYRPWFEHAHPTVVATARTMLEQLTHAGAQLVEIELPDLEILRVAHLITITLEMSAAMETHYREHRRSFGRETRINLALARYLNTTDYIKAQQVRARMMTNLNEIFEQVDVIATPATANLPPPRPRRQTPAGVSDLRSTMETVRFTLLANMTGNPAVTVPAGFVPDGDTQCRVPVGLQLIGRHWEEPLLLRIARVAEELVMRPRPEVYLSPF